MSRVSLNRRLAAVLDAAERIDPIAVRLYRLPPALRVRYDIWRAECDAIATRYENSANSGALYEAMLDGEFVTPDPPRAVAEALGWIDVPVLPETLTLNDLAELWARMID